MDAIITLLATTQDFFGNYKCRFPDKKNSPIVKFFKGKNKSILTYSSLEIFFSSELKYAVPLIVFYKQIW